MYGGDGLINVYLTHATADEERGAVSCAVPELERLGFNVRLGPSHLVDPGRLWREIVPFINSKVKTLGWLVYLSDRVLGDQVARDTLRYCLGGAASLRGADYPRVALCPGSLASEIPVDLGFSLIADMTDHYWSERARAGVEGRRPDLRGQPRQMYALALHHRIADGTETCAVELRPTTASWLPFFCAVPAAEHDAVRPRLLYGVRGYLAGAVPAQVATGRSADGVWATMEADKPANRSQSYFLACAQLPSAVWFGRADGHLHYVARLRPVR